MGNKTEFIELASCKASDNRNIVISEVKNGWDGVARSFTLAQQVILNESGKATTLYLKGALHVDSLEHLESLKSAIEVAIQKAKKV